MSQAEGKGCLFLKALELDAFGFCRLVWQRTCGEASEVETTRPEELCEGAVVFFSLVENVKPQSVAKQSAIVEWPTFVGAMFMFSENG